MKLNLKTKRLRLEPMTDEQMQVYMEAESDPHMRQAYGDMLCGSRMHPDQRQWYAAWKITLRDGNVIGDLCFKGPPQQDEVEIGYGISPAWQGQGYATEAVKAAMDWAFVQTGVTFVTAETEADNGASQRVLEKIGFVRYGEGAEGPRFEKEKPLTQWMVIYMMLGMGVGASLGASTGTTGIAIALGISVGLALGVALDAQEKTQRETLRARRSAERQTTPPKEGSNITIPFRAKTPLRQRCLA